MKLNFHKTGRKYHSNKSQDFTSAKLTLAKVYYLECEFQFSNENSNFSSYVSIAFSWTKSYSYIYLLKQVLFFRLIDIDMEKVKSQYMNM